MKNLPPFLICASIILLSSCNESETFVPQTGCNNNETRCIDSNLFVCNGSEWQMSVNCTDIGKICDLDANGKATCIDNQVITCVPSCKEGIVTRCDNENNATTETCSQNQICGLDQNGIPACVEKPEVKSCTPSCLNGSLTKCDAELNPSTETCANDEICGFDQNGIPACVEKTAPVVCAYGETYLLIGSKACDEEGKVIQCQTDGTMSAGTECTRGVCSAGQCVARGCDGIEDGQNTCKNEKLMVCDDGTLNEVTPGCGDTTPLCRDGENQCSTYKNCASIEHGQNGCKDGNIVACNDGTTSIISGGNCVEQGKSCTANQEARSGFICKAPDPTDCQWNGQTVPKGANICDGNTLRTCSADRDGELNTGFDCAVIDSSRPLCDSKYQICRAYRNCGNDEEIAHDSIVCNAQNTNKAKCVDGKLIDLSGDDACIPVGNASPVCIYSTEATCDFECNTGYTRVGSACESIKSCDIIRETYDKTTNTCTCNASSHWSGTAGNCTCENGYLLIGNECQEKATCSNSHNILDETTNSCVCDVDNHWIGKSTSCQCESGYIDLNGICTAIVSCAKAHTVWQASSNTCICDTTGHWTDKDGNCVCENGYLLIGNECQEKASCNAEHNKLDETTNTCVCDIDNHWIGKSESCQCENGYIDISGTCTAVVSCTKAHTVWQPSSNTCTCDTAGNWKDNGENCICKDGYTQVGNECQIIRTCDSVRETYDSTTNTCSCKAPWSGTAGSCACIDNYVQVGNTCEISQKPTCQTGEIYIPNANVCACDAPNGWVGIAGTCACPDSFVNINGICVKKAICNEDKEMYDPDNNLCPCDGNKFWEGMGPNCTCTQGKIEINNKCYDESICDWANHFVLDPDTETCICDADNGYVMNNEVCTCSANGYIIAFNHHTGMFECTRITNVTPGDTIQFGNDTDEPHEWMVLDKAGDKLFVIYKEPLTETAYCSTNECTWANSLIRNVINTFLGSFTPGEQARILGTQLTDKNTTDKIFVLSNEEIERYYILLNIDDRNRYWTRSTDEDLSASSEAYTYMITSPDLDRKNYDIQLSSVRSVFPLMPVMWIQ